MKLVANLCVLLILLSNVATAAYGCCVDVQEVGTAPKETEMPCHQHIDEQEAAPATSDMDIASDIVQHACECDNCMQYSTVFNYSPDVSVSKYAQYFAYADNLILFDPAAIDYPPKHLP